MRWISQPLSTAPAASVAMSRPLRKIVTVSEIARTSSRKCEMKTMLRPLARTPRSTSNRRCTSGGDRAEVGSSRMTMRAPENSTRASSISCCRPIASEPMRAPRIDVDAEVGEMPARAIHHGAPVDDAAPRRLLAEIDVLGHA